MPELAPAAPVTAAPITPVAPAAPPTAAPDPGGISIPAASAVIPSADPAVIPVTPSGPPSTPAATPAPPTPGDPPASWFSSLNEDQRGYIENKGFQDLSALTESYRNAEKLIGVDSSRLLTIPKEDATPEEWGKFYTQLGRPQDAKDYKLEIPKENADPAFAEWAQKSFHDIGLPRKQGEALVAKWNEYMAGQTATQGEAFKVEAAKMDAALVTEWGAAHAQNVNIATRAAKAFGVDGATMDKLETAMGFAGVMKFMHSIGTKIGEGSFTSADGSGAPVGFGEAILSPEAAKEKITSLRNDNDFVKRYTAGESTAKADMEKLHKWAYPEPSVN